MNIYKHRVTYVAGGYKRHITTVPHSTVRQTPIYLETRWRLQPEQESTVVPVKRRPQGADATYLPEALFDIEECHEFQVEYTCGHDLTPDASPCHTPRRSLQLTSPMDGTPPVHAPVSAAVQEATLASEFLAAVDLRDALLV